MFRRKRVACRHDAWKGCEGDWEKSLLCVRDGVAFLLDRQAGIV